MATGEATARGAKVASLTGILSVSGNVVQAEPVTSPVTDTLCLYYSIEAAAVWREGDAYKRQMLDRRHEAARFAIDDGTGPVWVDAAWGGDFEPMQTTEQIKAIGVFGHILGSDFLFGKYKLSTGPLPRGAVCLVTERVLPMVPKLYACGKIENCGIGDPGGRRLILSSRCLESSQSTQSSQSGQGMGCRRH